MDQISKLGVIKAVTEIAVSMGVSVVVGNLIKETTPLDANRFQRVMVGVGGYALGGLLGDMAAKRILVQVDDFAERINEVLNPKKIGISEGADAANTEPKDEN